MWFALKYSSGKSLIPSTMLMKMKASRGYRLHFLMSFCWFRLSEFEGTVPAHFYGEMAKTELGCQILHEKGHFAEFAHFIRQHSHESEDSDLIMKLKSILWAVVRILTLCTINNFGLTLSSGEYRGNRRGTSLLWGGRDYPSYIGNSREVSNPICSGVWTLLSDLPLLVDHIVERVSSSLV